MGTVEGVVEKLADALVRERLHGDDELAKRIFSVLVSVGIGLHTYPLTYGYSYVIHIINDGDIPYFAAKSTKM
jgi:hypothetical protein